jgi:formylglycine-generating enzyme required for sulfatase activity
VNSNKKAPKPKTTPRKPAKTTPSTAPANENKSKPDESAANERTYWESIRLSTDAEDFKAYLQKYPNGQYSDLARNTLRRLEDAAKEAAARADEARKAEATRKELGALKRPGAVVKNSIGMELVYAPAGSFMMGSERGDANEKPVHQVTIREGFYIGRYEVTQAQWRRVMGSNSAAFKGDNFPVDEISWEDAQDFIRSLNTTNDGYKYRLPSEAEWEYACRAGSGDEQAGNLDSIAWYENNSEGTTHPVGQKLPNGFGLYDMLGNVWEWCEDNYHSSYNGAPSNGSPWLIGGYATRMVRGGSWRMSSRFLRAAGRVPDGRAARRYGLRLVAFASTQ